jgi:hypothetical protein
VSFDGVAEELAIRARLSTLAGGRILDDTPDDESVPVSDTGKARPYIVLSVGVPFPKADGGRSFGEGEKQIPYTMTLVVGCYAGDRDSLNALYQAVVQRLVDWAPVPDNDTVLAIRSAVNGSQKAAGARPATYAKIVALVCTINMAGG